MGPPRFQPAFDERCIAKDGESLPVRYRSLATRALDYRNLFPVGRGSRERRIHGSFHRPWHTVDDGKIAAVDRMGRELLCEALVRYVALRDDQQSRRVLIDA